MIADDNGNIFDERRKKDRRQGERRTKNIKVEIERRSNKDRREKEKRK